MRKIEKDEMIDVNGGANGIVIASIVTAIVTFVIGIFNGYTNPGNCN